VSCSTISTDELAKITPVKPPIVNKKIKPIFHNITVSHLIKEPNIVETHEKILIPVGIAIIIVAAVK